MSQISGQKTLRQLVFGAWTLRSDGVLVRGTEVFHLPPKELSVLRILLASGGVLVTKKFLLDSVWHHGEVSEESLTRCIYVLRKLFGCRGSYIKSIYGKGYCFLVAVSEQELPAPPHASPVTSSVPSLLVLPLLVQGAEGGLGLQGEIVRQLAFAFGDGLCVMPARLAITMQATDDWLAVLEHMAPDYYVSVHCVVEAGSWTVSVELVRRADHALLHGETLVGLSGVEDISRQMIALLARRLPGVRSAPIQFGSFSWAYPESGFVLQGAIEQRLNPMLCEPRQA